MEASSAHPPQTSSTNPFDEPHHRPRSSSASLELLKEMIKLEGKGRRALAGEDSWTTLLTTFNAIYTQGSAIEEPRQLEVLPGTRDLWPKVLHVTNMLLEECLRMRPVAPTPLPATDGPASHVTILLTTARILYSHRPLQRLLTKYSFEPYAACLTAGLGSRETLSVLQLLRELLVCASGGGVDRDVLVANKRHILTKRLVAAFEDLLDAAKHHVVRQASCRPRPSADPAPPATPPRSIVREDVGETDGSTVALASEPSTSTGLLSEAAVKDVTVPCMQQLLDCFCSLTYSHRDTTATDEYAALRHALVKNMPLLFELSRDRDSVLRHRSCVLIKGLILDSDMMQATAIQCAAVSYGVLLWQLHLYVESIVADQEPQDGTIRTDNGLISSPSHASIGPSMLGSPLGDESRETCLLVAGAGVDCSGGDHSPFSKLSGASTKRLQEASKDLITLLCVNSDLSYEVMARVLPPGIMCMRCATWDEEESSRLLRPDLDHYQGTADSSGGGAMQAPSSARDWLSVITGLGGKEETGPKVRDVWFGARVRGLRKLPPGQSWRNVLHAVRDDWLTPELVWNSQTRKELLLGLQQEVSKLDFVRSQGQQAVWNHHGLEVDYPSYKAHLLVEGYFVESLVDALRRKQPTPVTANGARHTSPVAHIKEAQRLYFHLNDRAVIEHDPMRRVLCVRAMRFLCTRYATELRGLCPVRFVLAELVGMLEWHRSCGGEQQVPPSTHGGRDGVLLRQESDMFSTQADFVTHPWIRELVLLLLVTLEKSDDWPSAAGLVREMVRNDGAVVLMECYWYALSLVISSRREELGGHPYMVTTESSMDNAHSEVTVDVDEDDDGESMLHHSIFSLLLRLLGGMLRYSPAALQSLLHCQALPRVMSSFWVLAGHHCSHAGSPRACHYHDDLAISAAVKLLEQCLILAPDVGPMLLEAGLVPQLLAASCGADGRGRMSLDSAKLLRHYFLSKEVKQAGAVCWRSSFSRPSCLHPYLPLPLIRVLVDERPEIVLRVFNSTVTTSDVIWSAEHRSACFHFARAALEPVLTRMMEHDLDWHQASLSPSPPCDVDPYPDLTSRWQLQGVYLDEFIANPPEAFVRPIGPHAQDFLLQLLGPLSRTVKSRISSSSSFATSPACDGLQPAENLPAQPLQRAALLLQCIQKIVSTWSMHPTIWESLGVGTICACMDWALTSQESPQTSPGGGSLRITVLRLCCTTLLKVIDPVWGKGEPVEALSKSLSSTEGSVSTTDSKASAAGATAASFDEATTSCAERFVRSSGLSLAFEVARVALHRLQGKSKGSLDPGDADVSRNGATHCDKSPDEQTDSNEDKNDSGVVEQVCNGGAHDAVPSAASDASTASLELHQVLTAALLLALFALKAVLKQRGDAADERFRTRDFLRLVLLNVLLHFSGAHGSAAIVGLSLIEVLLPDAAMREAFMDLGGFPILVDILVRRGAASTRRASLGDVRHLAYGLLEGETLCEGCVLKPPTGTAEQECCLALRQRIALKAVEVLWRSTQIHPQDGVEMHSVARNAEAAFLQLFTPGLTTVLRQDRSPTRFLTFLFTKQPIRKPWMVWGPSMLSQLQEWVARETEAICEASVEKSRWPLWSVTEFLSEHGYMAHYVNLQQELVVGDIFLQPIVEEGDLDLGASIKVGPFLEALEVGINSSMRVLHHLASKPQEADADVLRAQEAALSKKQEAFDAVLRRHPEWAWRKNRILNAKRKK